MATDPLGIGDRVLVTVPATVVRADGRIIIVRVPGMDRDWRVGRWQVVPDHEPGELPSGAVIGLSDNERDVLK